MLRITYHDYPDWYQTETVDVPEAEYREWYIRDPKHRSDWRKHHPAGWLWPKAVCRARNIWLVLCDRTIDPEGMPPHSGPRVVYQRILKRDADSMLRAEGYEVLPDVDATADDDRQGAGKPSKGKGKPAGSKARQTSDADEQTPKELTLDDLTATAWKLLRALREMNRRDSETAVTREEIAVKASTGNANSKNVRDAFAVMKALGLIETRKKVGTWLTEAGMDALKSRQ